MLDLVLASVCVCVLVYVGVSSAHFEHFPFQCSQPASHREVPFHRFITSSGNHSPYYHRKGGCAIKAAGFASFGNSTRLALFQHRATRSFIQPLSKSLQEA